MTLMDIGQIQAFFPRQLGQLGAGDDRERKDVQDERARLFSTETKAIFTGSSVRRSGGTTR
jgi:hypothetical protein